MHQVDGSIPVPTTSAQHQQYHPSASGTSQVCCNSIGTRKTPTQKW